MPRRTKPMFDSLGKPPKKRKAKKKTERKPKGKPNVLKVPRRKP